MLVVMIEVDEATIKTDISSNRGVMPWDQLGLSGGLVPSEHRLGLRRGISDYRKPPRHQGVASDGCPLELNGFTLLGGTMF